MATIELNQPGRRVRTIPGRGLLGRAFGSYVVQSFFRVIATIWFVATLSFFLFRLLPSSPIDVFIQDAIVQRGATVEQAQAEATALFDFDLNRPLPLQYLDFMSQLARGNLGKSLVSRGTSVSSIIATYLPWTLFTVGLGVILSFTIGVALGTLMAYRRGSAIDHILSAIAAFLHGIPQFVLGLLMIFWFGVQWHWFNLSDTRGALSPGVIPGFELRFFGDVLKHAWLPIAAYVFTSISHWMLLMKNATTASLEEDYVMVARARGLSDGRIASAYVARNSILPLVTQAAITFGYALGGSVIIETLFVYRGIGNRLAESINQRDYPLMQGILLVLTAAIIFSNLLADILYSRIDPRVRVGGGSNR